MPTPAGNISYSPQFEIEMAAHWRGYSREAFYKMSGDEQATVVALFRLQNKIQAVQVMEQQKASERAAKK